MWVLGLVVGLALVAFGVYIILGRYVPEGSHGLTFGDRLQITSTNGGIFVLVIGIVIGGFSVLFLRTSSGGSGTEPMSPAAKGASPGGGANRRIGDTTASQPEAPTTTTIAPTTTTISIEGPWVGQARGLQLIVEGTTCYAHLGNRLGIRLRLENNAQETVSIPEAAFLAVDDFGSSYKADYRNSDWKPYLSLSPGQTTAGSLTLVEGLRAGTRFLDIRFNVYNYPGYFTVATTIPVTPC